MPAYNDCSTMYDLPDRANNCLGSMALFVVICHLSTIFISCGKSLVIIPAILKFER